MTNKILIIENDNILRKSYEQFLKAQTNLLSVFAANNITDALNIVDQVEINLIIIGFQVPEMDGLNLVTHLGKYHPNIRIIVMTDGISQVFKASYKNLNAAIFFERMSDVHLLIKRIFAELNIRHGGRITSISLSSFLQMIEMEKKSCTLNIQTKNASGFLYVKKGKLISARYGAFTGGDAALEILSWKNVSIEIDYTPPVMGKEINAALMPLLLEALRLADEKQLNRPDLRKYERQTCMIAMDFEYQDRSNHGFLWDISLGGAYIETDQTISVGADLILGLASLDQKVKCKVNAKVIRKDSTGVGILFEELSHDQTEIIGTLILNQFNLLPDDSDLTVSPESENSAGD